MTVLTDKGLDQEVNTYAVRSTNYGGSLMISVCDAELVGMILESDGLTINLTKTYWQERLVRDSEVELMLKKCAIANLVGKRIVNMAVSRKLAKSNSIKLYSGVPFLMLFRFTDNYRHNN